MRTLEVREMPVSLELARQHLRVGDNTIDDQLILAKLEMAVAAAEDATGRCIRERVVVVCDDAPNGIGALMRLPVPTCRIERISVSKRIVALSRCWLNTTEYESVLRIPADACRGGRVIVHAVVGYTEQTLPPALRAAILLLLGSLYDNESDVIVGRSVASSPLTAEKLLRPWRITPYGHV